MILRKNAEPVELKPEYYNRMGIGSDYWGVSLGAVPEEGKSYRDAIKKYLDKIEQAFSEGIGLFIQGLPQTGKTSLAIIVAKHVYSLYTPATGVSLLPMHHFMQAILGKKIPFYERRGLLILDDVGSEQSKEFSEGALEGIIRFRCDNRLPTIITTNLPETKLVSKYGENVLKQIQRKSFSILVGSVDWSKRNTEKLKEFFQN